VSPKRQALASASIAASPLQTPTSGPAEASVIIVNETTFAVRVNVDGSSTTVAAHATSAPMYFLPSDTNNDNYQMVSVPNPTCGMSDDGGYNLSARTATACRSRTAGCGYIGKTIVGGPTPLGEAFTPIS
jgi:hypothetical protein